MLVHGDDIAGERARARETIKQPNLQESAVRSV